MPLTFKMLMVFITILKHKLHDFCILTVLEINFFKKIHFF
ncbi:hypothetical protein PROVRUST_07099 [Providencia rustigianii DSM 4541]|uniref:Uncharacterized protein n=1 Tax=Providencia rustigianii DSM 4541 TaxID=500637 RepID=D1P4E7_9GAMM|nr:hypothetical protein PROVRUST_07099 [Providencia rustigianii DSM 4541]